MCADDPEEGWVPGVGEVLGLTMAEASEVLNTILDVTQKNPGDLGRRKMVTRRRMDVTVLDKDCHVVLEVRWEGCQFIRHLIIAGEGLCL